MKKLLLTLLASLVLTGTAWAGWVKVANTDLIDYYIDPASIRKDGNLRMVWELQNLKQRHKDGELSRRGRNEYDCKQERRRNLSFSMHSESMAEGTTLISGSNSSQWADMPPDTIGEWVLKIVCAK
jgi:hypothetical protein